MFQYQKWLLKMIFSELSRNPNHFNKIYLMAQRSAFARYHQVKTCLFYRTCKSRKCDSMKWCVKSVILWRSSLQNHFTVSARSSLKNTNSWDSKTAIDVAKCPNKSFSEHCRWQTRSLRGFCAHLRRIRVPQTLSKPPHNRAFHSFSLFTRRCEDSAHSARRIAALLAHRLTRLTPVCAKENKTSPSVPTHI